MIHQLLDPKNDLAFRRIFGTERNKDILIHFLNDVFGRTTNPIEDVTFLKTAQDPEIASKRQSVVDVLCEDTQNNRFIVEMQVAKEPGFEKRAQYYAAKAYISQREKGSLYEHLKYVTFLAITNFILFPEKQDYLSHHHILDTKTHERDLKEFSFSFLELPKFGKNQDQLITLVEKWAYFFKHAPKTTSEDMQKIIGSDHILGRAFEELQSYAWTEEELRAYDSIDMKQAADEAIRKGHYQEGKEEGEKIGEERGREEEKAAMILSMHSDGLDMATITRISGWSEEKVRQVIKASKP